MTDLGLVLLVLTLAGGIASIILLIQFFTGAQTWQQLRGDATAGTSSGGPLPPTRGVAP